MTIIDANSFVYEVLFAPRPTGFWARLWKRET